MLSCQFACYYKKDIIAYGSRETLVRPKTANQENLIAADRSTGHGFCCRACRHRGDVYGGSTIHQGTEKEASQKIILSRPVVEAGECLGYLPGDLEEKITPYLRPIHDALNDLIPLEKRKYYQGNDIIELAPLAYMRGRTLHHAFVILDEAQNTTAAQMKMFLTRMGINTKFIITGDTTQIDLPHQHRSGFLGAMKVLSNAKGIAFIHFDEGDMVRHTLVRSIIQAYERPSHEPGIASGK